MFEFSVLEGRWKDLAIKKKTISYKKLNSRSFRQTETELPITSDDSTSALDYTKVKIQASIKDVLLYLFSPHRKEFKLTIDYTLDEKSYQTTFFALVPNIEQE